jgi:hypothetical protein
MQRAEQPEVQHVEVVAGDLPLLVPAPYLDLAYWGEKDRACLLVSKGSLLPSQPITGLTLPWNAEMSKLATSNISWGRINAE